MLKKSKTYTSVGRRKRSVANVCIESSGNSFTVNKIPLESYFKNHTQRYDAMSPIVNLSLHSASASASGEESNTSESIPQFSVKANVKGGGITGQAEAIKLGLARSLVMYNEEWKEIMKQFSYLTRDSRRTERKKPGLVKARKRQQFKKR